MTRLRPQPSPTLPAGLCENNDGASAAFKGGLHGSHGHGLRGVSGQAGMASQVLKQLPVEGGCFGLPSDLNVCLCVRPEGVGGGGRGGYTQSHTTTTHRVAHT